MKNIARKFRKFFSSEIRAIHEVKSWPDEFEAVGNRAKTHEIRKHDRDYEVGDILLLREYDPIKKTYSGRMLPRMITHLTPGGRFGLPGDLCVMSIK